MGKFYKGQKVVALFSGSFRDVHITKGKTYTSNGYCKRSCCGVIGFLLEEFTKTYGHSCCSYCEERWDDLCIFNDEGFAPLQEKTEHNKAEINIKLLQPVEERIDAPIKVPQEIIELTKEMSRLEELAEVHPAAADQLFKMYRQATRVRKKKLAQNHSQQVF